MMFHYPKGLSLQCCSYVRDVSVCVCVCVYVCKFVQPDTHVKAV